MPVDSFHCPAHVKIVARLENFSPPISGYLLNQSSVGCQASSAAASS
jgi:hypothetical protein